MKPKYQQLADEVRSKIISKEYAVGSVIPPELKLMDIHKVSRQTVRQATALLVNEGFLRKEKGSGTYVDSRFLEEKRNEKERKTIGVITTYLSDYIFPSIIRGIEDKLQSHNYSLLLASTNNNLDQEKKCLENMLLQHIDGLIVEPTKSNQYNPNLSYYSAFKERGIPVLMINAYYEPMEMPSVRVDDIQVGYKATSFMLDKGHEKLALIVKLDDLQGKLRMKGFIEAFEKRKICFDSRNIYTYSTETKEKVLDIVCHELIENKREVTGIVCYNDEIAHLVSQKLGAIGKKVPEDFSIIGQDDSFLSTASDVQLTTLTHPKSKLGMDASKWIIEAVEKRRIGESILYEPQLIERQSVRNIN